MVLSPPKSFLLTLAALSQVRNDLALCLDAFVLVAPHAFRTTGASGTDGDAGAEDGDEAPDSYDDPDLQNEGVLTFKPTDPNDVGFDFSMEDDAGGDEFMSVKPWIGAIVAPSEPPKAVNSSPDADLDLQWYVYPPCIHCCTA